jgi:muramoyltetrapeptide carboxypeptidase
MKQEKLKPAALQTGDVVGVFAPASPVQREFVDRGLAWLKEAGCRCRPGAALYRRSYHVAGETAERKNDFEALLRDPDVRALFAARGGYGCLPLLAELDYELVRHHPKVIMGFSDVTALLLALWHKSRLVTFSGPMPAVEMARPGWVNEKLLWALLKGAELSQINNLMSEYLADPGIEFLRPGDFHGPALGGTLTLLSSLVGTPYMPDFTGKIIFIEDRGEPLYRVDRALTQLRLAGVFRAPAAVVCGDFSQGRVGEEKLLKNFLRSFFASDDFPVLFNFTYGHCPQSFIFPQGIDMQFACQKRKIILEESAVQGHGG